MNALITNDDGIASPGLLTLAQAAADEGLDVLVAAPSWDSSGASASLSAVERDGRFMVQQTPVAGSTMRGHAVEAAPAFIVRAAMSGAFGATPDVVLSGINHGPNTGHSVLHSGTVGAALTAATLGRPAIAVSLGVGAPPHWETAGFVARAAIRWLRDREKHVVLNVNVPNVAIGNLEGFERARLAAFGAVQATVTEAGAGYVKLSYTDVDTPTEPGTDAALLEAGIASFTPLCTVCEADGAETEGLELLVAARR